MVCQAAPLPELEREKKKKKPQERKRRGLWAQTCLRVASRPPPLFLNI